MNVIMNSVVMSGIVPNDNMLSDVMPLYRVWLCCYECILLSVVMMCVVTPSLGLYYETLYGSNLCLILIRQSVCHFYSLPT